MAERLDEMGALLPRAGRQPVSRPCLSPWRGGRARAGRPCSAILDAGGLAALERLPDIGDTLARAIRDIVRFGYSPMLARLRGDADPVRLLRSIPGIGRTLAHRLHDELGLESLEDLEAAAYDGRLEHLVGFGAKRLAGVRAVLAQRLGRVRTPAAGQGNLPSVDELLDVDREYREAVAPIACQSRRGVSTPGGAAGCRSSRGPR